MREGGKAIGSREREKRDIRSSAANTSAQSMYNVSKATLRRK